MKRIINLCAYIVIGIFIVSSIMLITDRQSNKQGTYNCGLAEISPDFTPAMREVCRKLRREQQ